MNAPGDFERHARGKKRKGGLHQRMARVAEDRDTPSALYMLLMTMLAPEAILSGVQCHQISVAAQRDLDGSKNDQIFNDLARLARLQRGQNLVRSVYTLLSKTTALPPPLQAPLPYKDGVHPAFILLPHRNCLLTCGTIKMYGKGKCFLTPTNYVSFGPQWMGILQCSTTL